MLLLLLLLLLLALITGNKMYFINGARPKKLNDAFNPITPVVSSGGTYE